jgi:hypothetical protein
LIKLHQIELFLFVLFIFTRLPELGHDNFNTDAWKWKARSYDFGTGIFTFQPIKTLQKYHPGVTLMWVGTFGVKITNLIERATNISPFSVAAIFLLDRVQKFLLVCVSATAIALIYFLLKKITSPFCAILCVVLFNLEPFYVALTRVFHLEGIMSIFMLVSTLSLYLYLSQGYTKKYLFISAIGSALAILTKTSAVFMLPFTVFALMFFDASENKIWTKVKSKKLGIWLVTLTVTCLLLWPALWAAPAEVFRTIYKGIVVVGVDTEHYQFYFDKYVDNPGPLFYFVVIALRSSVYLLPGLVLLLLFWHKLSSAQRRFTLYLVFFSIFYLLELTLPSKKLDRYILPAILTLSICTGIIYDFILNFVLENSKNLRHKTYVKMLIALVFVSLGLFPLVVVHPDYFSYYNPYLGGLAKGIHILEPKWMIGTREIMAYFKQKAADQKFAPADESSSFEGLVDSSKVSQVLTVGFPEKYYTQIWPFFREQNAWAVVQDLTPFAVKTKYFVYPVWDDDGVAENRFSIKLIDAIYVRGVKVYNVYERIN